MNLRWLWLDHVPQEIRLTREQRRDLDQLVSRSKPPLPMRTQLVGFSVGLPIMIVWFALFSEQLEFFVQWFGPPGMILHVASLWFGLWLILAAVSHLLNRGRTYEALSQMGFDICKRCGYWLRGLGDDVKNCPECGAARAAMPSERVP